MEIHIYKHTVQLQNRIDCTVASGTHLSISVQFLDRFGLDTDPGHLRKTFKATANHCSPCQQFAQAPCVFKIKLTDKFCFHHTAYADIFYDDKKAYSTCSQEGFILSTCYMAAFNEEEVLLADPPAQLDLRLHRSYRIHQSRC